MNNIDHNIISIYMHDVCMHILNINACTEIIISLSSMQYLSKELLRYSSITLFYELYNLHVVVY